MVLFLLLIQSRCLINPTISLAADPTSGCIPLDVQFTGSVNVDPGIDITGYSWAFGDGSSDLAVNPITSHT
ncbi:MAG: PKD domain-containing protein [Saprospiraceae bacterium]